jgi:hypothetical protein
MLICRECFNIHCMCKNKKKFECDELMLFPIKTLNQKGYRTDFCCSGHITDKKLHFIRTYILFKEIYDFKKPLGFLLENEKTPYYHGGTKRTCISKTTDIQEQDYEKQLKIIFKNIKILNKWVKELKDE